MMHIQTSHYLSCQSCGQTVTHTTPDFLDALATGEWPETSRSDGWWIVDVDRGDEGSLTVNFVQHTPGRCARVRRRKTLERFREVISQGYSSRNVA